MSARAAIFDEVVLAEAWNIPAWVDSGTIRWPRPSMTSGEDMKAPSFLTMRGPAQTRSSNDGAYRLTLTVFRSCWAVHAVKFCQTLEFSKGDPGARAASAIPPCLIGVAWRV